MLTGIHFLLTYKCIYECDHCFVYSSPNAEGTFTYDQFSRTLDEAKKIGTIESIYLEGGEPFLYYPLMLDFAKLVVSRGFSLGIVTNAYFATSVSDAERWLKPLKDLDIEDLSISDDVLHSGENVISPASIALQAAKNLGIRVKPISIDSPEICAHVKGRKKGEPVVSGDVLFRGRAADKLTKNLPGINWKEFDGCRWEDLETPERVHVDAYGNVQVCQGISIGNMWQTPLSEIFRNYDANANPIVQCLLLGGPALLAEHFKTIHRVNYVDACHLCYETRKQLIDRYPEWLAPRQVYGL